MMWRLNGNGAWESDSFVDGFYAVIFGLDEAYLIVFGPDHKRVSTHTLDMLFSFDVSAQHGSALLRKAEIKLRKLGYNI